MNGQFILIVDNDSSTVAAIKETLRDAGIAFAVVSGDTEAWNRLRTDPSVTQVLLRYLAPGIDGCRLCRRVREVKTAQQLPIVMVLPEAQLQHGQRALEAGANDILVAPFEARELRMRACIVPDRACRRIDARHSDSARSSNADDQPVDSRDAVIVPEFDPATCRLVHDLSAVQQQRWDADAGIRKVVLDTVLVCPECQAVPTFRYGCSHCGSGITDYETFLHHFACAYVGRETEFRQATGLTCPKCHLSDLCAETDLESVQGQQICGDCRQVVRVPDLIGHCLSCDRRFSAREARTEQLTGYHVPGIRRVRSAPEPAARQNSPPRGQVVPIG